MLLNHGMHEGERILPRTAVELMTTNRLSPEQLTARDIMFSNVAHLSSGQGRTAAGASEGGAHRGDYAPPLGQFGWFGGTGTTAYADRINQLTEVLLTQVGLSTPDSPRAMNDSWTTLYQAID